MRIFLIVISFLLSAQVCKALDTEQQIFYPRVQTLSITNPDYFMAPPVVRFGTNDRICINFDIIGDSHEYLRYRLIHCNYDWQPSRLMESEFIEGFNEVEITDYAYSSNTYVHYVNYNIIFPNPDLPILVSGNYLVQIFPENDPDDILLQARFSVSEESSVIHAGLTSRTDKGYNTEYQQLFFNVDLGEFPYVNPYQDLIVTITQNNRPATTKVLTHPLRVESGCVVFEHSPEMIFEAGNEYRRFETVRNDYPGMHVETVKFQDGMWHAYLKPDYSRKYKEYIFDNTQHGRFKIDEYNSSDPDLSADYIMVHFTLDPGEKTYGQIYVDGDFTNHQINDKYLMKYNWEDGLYHASIPLKQGSYNYQYLVIPENGKKPSTANIEGNKFETQNEYLIKVFLRRPGSRGDRLIGTYLL